MHRLHRIHAGFILAAKVFRALLGMAFGLLLIAGIIWVVNQAFSGRNAKVLTGFVIVWAVIRTIRRLGEFLGPPEPVVKTGTQLERRRALRRAGMLGRR